MTHEARTQNDATFLDGYTILRTDLESLDAKSKRGVNGDDGGAWAPTSPIELATSSGFGTALSVTGPLEIRGAGHVTLPEIHISDDSNPLLAVGHPGRTRTMLQPTIPFMSYGSYPWAVGCSPRYQCAQPLALTFRDSQGAESSAAFVVALRVHDGATLSRLVFHFRVPEQRLRAPVAMPRFGVYRVDVNGVAEPLKSTVTGDGFDSPKNPGSAAAWFSGGALQSFEYLCDQNNVVDISRYRYIARIVEESGATEYPGRLDVYTANRIERATTDPVDLATVSETDTVDGTVFDSVGGVGTLLKNQASPAENGFYVTTDSGSPHLVRSPAWHDDAGTPTNGAIFPIIAGAANSSTVWQLSRPTPSVLGLTPMNIAPPVPRGNAYTSIEVTFSNIVDCRWQ